MKHRRNTISESQTQKKAEAFDALRALLGYVQNGTDSKVTISEDDATRNWVIRLGHIPDCASSVISGKNLAEALIDAAAEHGEFP